MTLFACFSFFVILRLDLGIQVRLPSAGKKGKKGDATL